MVKGKHFFGQPVYGQLIKYRNKDKIVETSRNHGGERYIKSFDGGIKVHTVISANENAPCDVKYTSEATNDSFMLVPSMYSNGRLLPCHQDSDSGHADSKSANGTTSTETGTQVELRLATMVRIVLMYYINLDSFLEKPDDDMKRMLAEAYESPPEDTEILQRGLSIL